MPIFLDRHTELGVTPEELFEAHLADIEAQEKFGVKYLSYWFDYDKKSAYCLVDAPDTDKAAAVHREAHGVMADKFIAVNPAELWKYMGGGQPGFDPNGVNGQTMRTIVFTDIVGSTDAGNTFGDDAALAMLRTHNQIVREQLETHGGREVKHTGDGIMASFASNSKAIECSLAIQTALASHNERGGDHEIHIRIGLAAGEPIAEDDDLFGTAVNLAARVCDAAERGAVFVTKAVRDLAMGKAFEFEHVADLVLKGFPEPVPVARVLA